jgi:hypothetical protein
MNCAINLAGVSRVFSVGMLYYRIAANFAQVYPVVIHACSSPLSDNDAGMYQLDKVPAFCK